MRFILFLLLILFSDLYGFSQKLVQEVLFPKWNNFKNLEWRNGKIEVLGLRSDPNNNSITYVCPLEFDTICTIENQLYDILMYEGNIKICYLADKSMLLGSDMYPVSLDSLNSIFTQVIKIDSSGHILWNKLYGQLSQKRQLSGIQASDSIYGIAYSNSYKSNLATTHYGFLSIDTAGNIQNEKSWGWGLNNFPTSLINEGDDFLIDGSSDWQNGYLHIVQLKVNTHGDSLLSKEIVVQDSMSFESSYSTNTLLKLSDGGYIESISIDNNTGSYSAIYRTDSLSNVKWFYKEKKKSIQSLTKVVELFDKSLLVLEQYINGRAYVFSLYHFTMDGAIIDTIHINSTICNSLFIEDFVADSNFAYLAGSCQSSPNEAYLAKISLPPSAVTAIKTLKVEQQFTVLSTESSITVVANFPSDNFFINVYNEVGVSVKEIIVTDGKISIYKNDFDEGLYMLKIVNKSGAFSYKFVN